MIPSQSFLEFKQIKEGVIILKNRAMRGVLLVSSINFDLKSEEEQNAIIFQFQNFLNSLDFSCQVIIQSRRLNITSYFEKLKEFEKKHSNELLKIQTAEYRKFVEELVGRGTIMTKQFFVVVPYTLGEVSGAVASMAVKPSKAVEEELFQRCRDQLYQRLEFVATGLRRCGLNVVPLTTPEIIELFWAWHHPKEAEIGYYPEILPELSK
jgi:hypothetical protein